MGGVGWGGVGDMLAHSVRDRDRNASCTDPITESRAAIDDEGEGLVKGSVASATEISEEFLEKFDLLSEFKKFIFFFFLI